MAKAQPKKAKKIKSVEAYAPYTIKCGIAPELGVWRYRDEALKQMKTFHPSWEPIRVRISPLTTKPKARRTA